MQDEKWKEVVGMVKDKFEVIEEEEEPMEDIPRSKIERIVFEGPLGKMKLERETKPVVLDKKTTYSKRMGDTATVEYVYSEDEYAHKFKAYAWKGDDWVEIEAGAFDI
ncbi:hypothetical protein GWN26_04570 [Candidatus Saccharibacteria bacterium]|nr:hypothetical protein [Candidatus Saccharibacteria bacterium]NIV03507.1 hypothetical protein [Calditrichia bacterium]NIS38052.1 hypothetical protein [Candidatus Saccharibacteria bacterium]NIV71749.1 hypothetical protein [Calditrichia bacterium]NIV98447.1 hypothetical protein [Candidatus Saccharibacteria bacterium]